MPNDSATPTGKKTSTFGAKDISMQMDIKFNEVTVIPEIKAMLGEAIWAGIKYFKANFERLVMLPLLIGGAGWNPLNATSAWKWINSPAGYGQLGFEDKGEIEILLKALLKSYNVELTGKPGVGKRGKLKIKLKIEIFDIPQIISDTPHPAAGEGNLDANRSWFEWIYKGLALSEPATFVRKSAGISTARSYDIAGGRAGIMTSKGASFWSVPPRLRLDLDSLLTRNEDKIMQVMNDTIARRMNVYLG